MSKWIKKGDKVVVVSGNDKGKVGDVIVRKGDRVVIQGINVRKKHAKRQQKMPGTEILEMEMPLLASKVAFCNSEGKPVKVRVRLGEKGEKELYYLEGDKQVSLRQLRKSS